MILSIRDLGTDMSQDNPTVTPLLRTITEVVTRRLRITTHGNMDAQGTYCPPPARDR